MSKKFAPQKSASKAIFYSFLCEDIVRMFDRIWRFQATDWLVKCFPGFLLVWKARCNISMYSLDVEKHFTEKIKSVERVKKICATEKCVKSIFCISEINVGSSVFQPFSSRFKNSKRFFLKAGAFHEKSIFLQALWNLSAPFAHLWVLKVSLA